MNVPYVLTGPLRRLRERLSASDTAEGRNIRLFYLDTAWNGVVGAGTGTFLSVYMARIGASSFMISALTALPALLSVLVSLPASSYIERQHDHVRVTTRFRIAFRSTYLILAFLPFFLSEDLLSLAIVLLWSVQAVPMAITILSWTSVVGDIVPPRKRARVNGERWALLSLVSAVFVALFGKLLDSEWLPFPLNYQLVFFISAIAGFLSMSYFARIKTSTDFATALPARMSLRERAAQLVGPMLHSPSFINYLLATFVVRLGIGMPVALYSIFWVNDLRASDTVIGIRTTVGQATLIIGYYLFGRLASRHGHRNILLVSAIGLGLYPVVTAFLPNQFWLLPAAILWGFFTGGINISFFEGLLETTPPNRRPSFAALNAVFANLAIFVGPLLGSLLMEWLGIRIAFFVAGALHVIGAWLCWRLRVGMVASQEGLARPATGRPQS